MIALQGFRPSAGMPVRMRGDAEKEEIDYSKMDPHLSLAVSKGKLPISLFVQTKAPVSKEQVDEMKKLGLTVNPIVGNISTAQLTSLDNLAKITRLPYISYMEGSVKLYPNKG